jgi:hypothetical protein
MTKLIRVGFFREMRHGDQGDPSLAEARGSEPGVHQDAIAAYLAAGQVMIATPGIAKDVINGKTVIGSPSYLTDGVYVWPADVAYYVKTYNVRLPTEFLEHAMANGFKAPTGIDVKSLKL